MAEPPWGPAGAIPRTFPVPWRDGSYWPKAGWNPGDDNNVFVKQLPLAPRLHTNSTAIATEIYNGSSIAYGLGGGPGHASANPTTYDYHLPCYFAKEADQLYTIVSNNRYGTWPYQNTQIRCPSTAEAVTGTDRHLTVVQPDGVTWNFWETYINHSTRRIDLTWGGPGKLYGGITQKPGSIAAETQPIVGLLHPQELRDGLIPHALQCVVRKMPNDPVTGRTAYVYPAVKGASGGGPANSAWCGMRLKLAYSEADIVALSVDPWQKTILRCLRDYGTIITDTGGYQLFRMMSYRNWTTLGYDNPWATFHAERITAGDSNLSISGGERLFQFRNGITFDSTRLQVVRSHEGQHYP